MYRLAEKDLMPESTDDFVAEGETKEEVNEQLMAHAKEAHGDMVAQQTPEQTQAMMDKANELLAAQDTPAAE